MICFTIERKGMDKEQRKAFKKKAREDRWGKFRQLRVGRRLAVTIRKGR